MPVTINGTTGITTPGVTNSGNETVSGTLAVTGAVTGSGLSTTLYPLVSGTAVASTSGTSIDFTGIPSWVKRITVMFNGVSTNGTAHYLIQLGDSGGVETTGYLSYSAYSGGTNAAGGVSSTSGFIVFTNQAYNLFYGHATFTLSGSNLWVGSNVFGINSNSTTYSIQGGGTKTLSDVLDRVRITTSNGTDTFDAGSINILYE